MTDKTNPPPDPAFAEALVRALEAAVALRDALIALTPAAPQEPAEWIATMTSTPVAEDLGALQLLTGKNAGLAQSIVAAIGQAVGANAPGSVDDVAACFTTGQVDIEMSCPCGQCPPCVVRAKVGDAEARRQITEAMRPQGSEEVQDRRRERARDSTLRHGTLAP